MLVSSNIAHACESTAKGIRSPTSARAAYPLCENGSQGVALRSPNAPARPQEANDPMAANVRKRIAYLVDRPADAPGMDWYSLLALVGTFAGIVPLAFKGSYNVFKVTEAFVTIFFTIDYAFMWLTVDLRTGTSGAKAFLRYPFTRAAIIDLLSLLPSYVAVSRTFRLLRTARLARLMRLLKMTRVFRAMRYSSSLVLIARVLRREREPLVAVSLFALAYVLLSALVIFNVEPDIFATFFDAVYWSTVSLTTVGYGDIYPVSNVGRIVAMISSVLGIAVVALPASIITAGFMQEIEDRARRNDRTSFMRELEGRARREGWYNARDKATQLQDGEDEPDM